MSTMVLPSSDGEERLPPAHARGHQACRQHVGRDAVRHADPQRGVVVGRPGAAGERNRREVVVVEGAAVHAGEIDELDAAVGVLDLVRSADVQPAPLP